jgi:lipoprotein-anchoring transpeptidase ErfK/SrfK
MATQNVRTGFSMVGRRVIAVVTLAVVAPLTVAACSSKSETPKPAAVVKTPPTTEASTPPAEPAVLKLSPASGKKDAPLSTEVGLSVTGGKVTDVVLKDAKGKAVSGTLREDSSAWVPAKTLKAKETYAATVTAQNATGQTTTATTKFTTMATPGRKTGTGLYLFDDKTYGVAMPVVAEFSPGIKKANRASVQKRFFVKTDPPQPGAWSWTSTGTQAYYRAPDYWKAGTKISVRLGLGGLPMGGGRYGSRDRAATAKIGRNFVMKVDNKAKKMVVSQDGKTIRTMPVSLGKPSTPSSSGTMVIMDKQTSTVFDTTDTDGANGYKMTIAYAQRLTWSGQFIHSAPWSTGAQGHRNVSHGCVNLSPSNATWLFGKTLIGDPITVKGTGDKLVYGNGWTPWNVSWKEFVKGSALPVPADLA